MAIYTGRLDLKELSVFVIRPAIIGERFMLSIEHAILEAVRGLPAEKQQEILSHATRLRGAIGPKKPLKSIKGLWSDLGISLSAEEIEESQQEMWKSFPREDT